MSGLFAGTPLERPVTCEVCEQPLETCRCPRDAGGQVRPPSEQTLLVRVEKRKRGKVVTVVQGLDPVASDCGELLKTLRTRCGAGGTERDGVLEIQGDHRDAVTETLTAAGYPLRGA